MRRLIILTFPLISLLLTSQFSFVVKLNKISSYVCLRKPEKVSLYSKLLSKVYRGATKNSDGRLKDQKLFWSYSVE